MPADASRRFLVVAGTEHYDIGDELGSVPEDLRKIAEFFERLGYREQLPEVCSDPSSGALRSALAGWLNGLDRRASDTAVIYYSGHGDTQAGYFYLLTADTKENRYADTALRADFVLEALGENPKVRRLLLILDTCYAGQGAFDASGVAARMSPWQNFGDGEGIWVVAAASPKQEAQERVFADAFLEAARQLQQTTGPLQPYIGLESLMEQINGILRRHGKQQQARYIPVTQAMGLAPFIPNPRYEPDAPANMDLETRDWLRRRHAAELAEYWGAKARGVEVAAQAGWYFTGRQAAMAELSGWLAEPASDIRLRVLTGDPGSGKSAVMGRLVTLADKGSAPKPPAGTHADPRPMTAAGRITVALLARGKTADELLAELTASLGVAPSTELTDTFLAWPVFTVVIDALDEATGPQMVIEQIILPLLGAASPGHGPRLLVATRRYQHLLGSLPAARVTIDLDQDTYHSETDITEYVTKMLLAADDPDSPTPYRDRPDLARPVARQVASIAGHSFLIAQIAARTLARTPRALDPAEVSADRQRWRDVGTAFDRDLDRYGEQARRVRDLLTPLAWAEGAGLPRELWAPLATALADDETYEQADITWLLAQAGFYLVETLDQDRSVYRLYHEQFAEHLRATVRPNSAQERITAELLRHVPAAAAGCREWLAATPYIRTHLATHAAKAGVLDPLVNDPGFLLAADPARLLPTLATVTDPEARKSAGAFESTQHLLPGQPPGQATAQLDLAARVHDAAMLAVGIGHLPYTRPWTIAWGHWARPDRHVLLGRHEVSANCVASAKLDDTPIAVTGGDDGTVRVWDLRTGTARGKPLRGQGSRVYAVAVGEVDGTLIAASSDYGGTVQVWDLRTGTPRGKPLPGQTGGVKAVAVGEVDGTPIAVTGGSDGTLQVWDLRTGTARGKPLRGRGGRVWAVAVGKVDGIPVAVTGSDGGTVRVWDLRTGTARGKPLRGHFGFVPAVAVGEVDGTRVAVTGGYDRTVRVWDLRTGTARGKPLRGHDGFVGEVAVGEVDGTPIAVTGSGDGTVRVWDLRTGTARGKPLRGHYGYVGAVAVGEVDGTPIAVTGGRDGTVRVWDLQTGTARREPPVGHTHLVNAVAVGKVDGTPIAVTGGRDGTVRVWDLQTGTAFGEPLRAHYGSVGAVAVGEVDGTPIAVTGADDHTVSVWDLRTGRKRALSLFRAVLRLPRQLVEFTPSINPNAVAVGEVDGGPVAIYTSLDGTVRMRDLRTGTARGKPLRGQAGWFRAVAIGEVDGTPVAVYVGPDDTVRVRDLRNLQAAHGKTLDIHADWVRAMAIGEVDGTPVAVCGGSNGKVRLWDLRTGTACGEPPGGHTGQVDTVAVGEVDGIPVVVTGDDQGTVLMRAIDPDQHDSVRLDVPAGINAIIFGGQIGWLTVTNDGSLFIWRPALAPRRALRQL